MLLKNALILLLLCVCLILSMPQTYGKNLFLDLTYHRYILCFRAAVPQQVIDLVAQGFNVRSHISFNYTEDRNDALWRNPRGNDPESLLTYNRLSFNFTLPFFRGITIDVPVNDSETNNAIRGLISKTSGNLDVNVKDPKRFDGVRVAEFPSATEPDVFWRPPGVADDRPMTKQEKDMFDSLVNLNSPNQVMEALNAKANSFLRFVEVSQILEMSVLQTNAPWGLNRICQRDLLLDGNYYYNSAAGLGIDCYVLDTGIQATHVEFENRAVAFADFTGDGFADVLGHGTHVAGIIGAKTYGVAKKASLVGVKVIYDNGVTDYATLISALNWVYSHVQSTGTKSLINLSLSGPISASCNSVIDGIVAAGIPVVAAAGNNNANACSYSPASAASAICVGATQSDDYILSAPSSNYGSCVDMFAPGGSILSTFSGSNTALAFMSGTSMAAPHVVGALAITWSAMPTLTAAGLISRMISRVSLNYLFGLPAGTANKLVYGARYV